MDESRRLERVTTLLAAELVPGHLPQLRRERLIVAPILEYRPQRIPQQPQAALRDHFADAVANDRDGLRLDWPDRWLLIRASNTEPIVRAIAEAPTREEAHRLCDEAGKVLLAVGDV